MTVDDVLALQRVDAASIDPGSEIIAIVVQRPSRPGEALLVEGHYGGNIRADLLMISAESGKVVMRTNGYPENRGYWHPVWSPSGRSLAMLTFRADTVSLCVWHRQTRVISCMPDNRSLDYMTQISAGITPRGRSSLGQPFLWLSDSVLAVALLPDGDLDRLSLATHKVADSIPASWRRSALGREASVTVLATPRRPISSPTFAKVALWNVERGTTRAAFEIPYYGDGFRDVVFSRQRDWAVVLADQFYSAPDPEWLLGFRSRVRKKLGVVHLGDGATVKWLASHSYSRFVRWAPGGDRFGVLAASSVSGSDTGGDTLFAVNPGTGAVASAPDSSADSKLRWVASLAPTPAQSALPRIVMRAELAAGSQVMLEPADELLAVAPDGGFAVVRRFTADGTIIYQRFATGAPPRVLLRLNSHLADLQRSSRRSFSYSARDGSEQRAVVLLPPGFEAGVQFPLVTWVYPGDVYRDTVNTSLLRPDDDPQAAFLSPAILAGHGYVVLFPSMPLAPYGSAGDPYDHMLDGVDAAIDTLIIRGIADSTRLGLFGHSYGGYAVNCIVSQSSRFRAAVTSAGLTDLTSFALQFYPQTQFSDWPAVELSLMETGQGRMGSPPWRDPGRYVRNSPLYYVEDIRTPLLISAGDNDFPGQAEELFTAMDRSGKRARLMVFHGEGHVLLSPANIRYFWHSALKWFDDYLQPTRPTSSIGSRHPGSE